jgi:hypothetical protein
MQNNKSDNLAAESENILHPSKPSTLILFRIYDKFVIVIHRHYAAIDGENIIRFHVVPATNENERREKHMSMYR